jgi:hypothetical protein
LRHPQRRAAIAAECRTWRRETAQQVTKGYRPRPANVHTVVRLGGRRRRREMACSRFGALAEARKAHGVADRFPAISTASTASSGPRGWHAVATVAGALRGDPH